MKKLFVLLGIVIIIALAVFTGTWILNIVSLIFNFISKMFGFVSTGLKWLAEVFNFFGWNSGVL